MTSCRRCGRWHLLLGAGGSGTVWERPALLSGARYFVVPKELPGPGLPYPFLSWRYASSSSVGAALGDFRVMGVYSGVTRSLACSFVACV